MRRLKELIVDLPSPCGLRRTGGNGSPLGRLSIRRRSNFGPSGWMSKHLVNGVMVGLVGHVFVAKSQSELPISQGVRFDGPAESIKNLPEPFRGGLKAGEVASRGSRLRGRNRVPIQVPKRGTAIHESAGDRSPFDGRPLCDSTWRRSPCHR